MLALEEKAAQVVFPRLGSNMIPPVRVENDLKRFSDLLKLFPFGGLVLFNGSSESTPYELASLQRQAHIPLLVGSDIERGTGQQLTGGTVFPHARALAKAGLEATRNMAKITAREALASGIHIAFAPVADVNTDPRNPIIGIRSFGTSPEIVSTHVRHFIHVCQKEGLFATAKHFPGHGNTSKDSHAELPIVTADRDQLEKGDLQPFYTAIQSGVSLIMTAHVAFPQLDPAYDPATISQPILTTLLRNHLNFKGIIVSDSLIMRAIYNRVSSIEEMAGKLLNAGVDILLDPPDPVAMVEGIIASVEKGIIPVEVLDQAVYRINTLRKKLMRKFGEKVFTDPFVPFSKDQIGAEKHIEESRTIAFEALPQRSEMVVPVPILSNKRRTRILLIMPYRTHLDPLEQPLGQLLKHHHNHVDYVEIDDNTLSEELNRLSTSNPEIHSVIACIIAKPSAWRKYGLPAHLSRFLKRTIANFPTMLISLGDPGIMNQFPGAISYSCTYSDTSASQHALLKWLVSGK